MQLHVLICSSLVPRPSPGTTTAATRQQACSYGATVEFQTVTQGIQHAPLFRCNTVTTSEGLESATGAGKKKPACFSPSHTQTYYQGNTMLLTQMESTGGVHQDGVDFWLFFFLLTAANWSTQQSPENLP